MDTKELFTFELDLGAGKNRPTGTQLEDMLYNCLDFCVLYHRQAHFFLTGADAAHHPELWHILEILREEDATFSLLSEPEQSEFAKQDKDSDRRKDRIVILPNGEASGRFGHLGNVFCDRLGDLWEVSRLQEGRA